MIGRWLADLSGDLRFALRQWRRAPAVAALVIVTLAIGIGANVTMAGVISHLLLRGPAHIKDPDRVVRLLKVGTSPSGASFASPNLNYPEFLDFQRGAQAFESTAAFSVFVLSLGSGPDAIAVHATLVSGGFFPLFGVAPELGRLFSTADRFPDGEASGGPALAVLAHGFWERQFAGDRAVVGRSLRIGSVTYTVVGVAPRDFQGVETESPDVWLPVSVAGVDVPAYWFGGRGANWLSIVARLRPGVSPDVAAMEATAIHLRSVERETTGWSRPRLVAASVIRGRGPDKPREVNVALWLGGVSALVLIIACANVANLLLARALARRREIAVRLAMGAGRSRIARQMLAEALLFAVLGAGAAMWLALVGGRLLQRFFVTDIATGGFIDARMFALAAAITLGTAVAISLAPLVQSTALDLTVALRAGATGGGGRTSHVRAMLLVTQSALCTVLLIGAGLFSLSLRRVEGLDLGLDVNRTLIASFDMSRSTLPVVSDYEAALRAVREGVLAVPGVRGVALNGQMSAVGAHTATRSWDELVHSFAGHVPMEITVDSGYFRTLGTASLRGRDFDDTDRLGAEKVAIVSAPLARVLFGGREPIGECVMLPMYENGQDEDCVRVIGVARGFWSRNILDRDAFVVYVPLAQRRRAMQRPNAMYVAVAGDDGGTVQAVRAAIQRAHHDLPAVTVTRFREVLDSQFRPWRLAATMFTAFGAVALVIAIVGLYGVVSYAAEQRSSEIAVRIALGARTRHVLFAVGGDGLRSIMAGLVIGGVAALAARRWIGALLFQTSPDDPRIIGGVAALLLAVAVLAVLVPTARALRRDTASVLRLD